MFGKHISFAALAIAVAAISCSKQFEAPASEVGEQLVPVEISVSLESPTKTSFDGVSKVTWSPGDSIAVSKFVNGADIYYLTTAEGGSPAIFRGELPAGIGKVKAFYPYRYVLSNSSETNFKFKYPQTQFGKVGSVADNMIPMVAVTENLSDSLIFHPICALAKVSVKGNDISSITLSLTPANPSSDVGYLWADVINVSTHQWNTSTSKGSPVSIMVPESGETFTPGDYFFSILTKTSTIRKFNGVKISYQTIGEKVYERSSTNSISFARAKVYTIPGTEVDTYKGIFTAADLVAFADSVNAGKSIDRFCVDGVVTLQKDIDMSEVSSWTPIGMPTSTSTGNSACTYEGPSFKGVFDGTNHKIYNFTVTASVADASVFGLFGLIDGGTVRNLILGKEGDNSLVTVSAAGTSDAGVLVGVAYNGTAIRDCENNIPLKVEGSSIDNKRFSCGCFVGYACSTDNSVSMSKLVNNAPIKTASGSNTKNGATGVMAGGIAGFCTGSGNTVTMIEDCENYGEISGACGRTSGIVATMNAKSMMRYCTNRGNVSNDFVNARVGNLTCIMGSGCSMDECANYGDCITSDPSTTTAGMVALLNADNVVVTGGGNYGKIISSNEQYHGLLVANFSKFSSFKAVYVSGSCGTYSKDGKHTMHELTKDNWIKHIGSYSSAAFSKITDLRSDWGNSDVTGGELPELKDAALRILFIGNSFTQDAVTHLPGICEAAGASDITMAHLYYGGRTISQYYDDRTVANNTLYYANPGDKKFTQFGTKASIESLAKSSRWDIVTIQEHTGTYLAWIWNDAEKNAVNNLIGYVAATQTTKPKFFYIMSQAYHDNGKIGSSSQGYVTWNDHAGMFKVIVAQGKKVMDNTSVDDIIATGTMLENLRTSSINNNKNLSRDGYHMDYGIARYGAACTVFEKIVTPVTGKTLEGNTFRFTGSDAATTTNVTDENAPIARQAAHYAVEKPFEVTNMGSGSGGDDDDDPSVTPTLSGKGTQAEPYLITKGEDMTAISGLLVEGETKYFEMAADIDMSKVTDWSPINMAVVKKDIVFDGKNHKISGFTCTNKTYTSIFGLLTGCVKNLIIENPVVINNNQLGVVATWLGQNDGSWPAEVSNVDIIDAKVYMTNTSSNKYSAGLIAANCGGATVTDCNVSGRISSEKGYFNCVGGVVGRTYASTSVIRRCSFSGDIEGAKGQIYGGIVGGMSGGVKTLVEDCYSTGNINSHSAGYVGGIVGELCQGSTVKNCYSTMSITGFYCLGGIVGRASDGKNPNSHATVHFDTDMDMTVTGCIAWNESITGTNLSAETPASHYSSGAVVGFSLYKNTLSKCCRRPDMAFKVYMDAVGQYNTLVDSEDWSPSTPYVKPSGAPTFLCWYNGKAAAAGSTVSSVASSLGWSTSTWNLDSDYPKFK